MKKNFRDMNQKEMVEVMIKGGMPDGTVIPPHIAKANLHRLLPMLKDTLAKNKKAVMEYDVPVEKMKKDIIWKKFIEEEIEQVQELIEKAEKICNS